MGTFTVPLDVGDPARQRFRSFEALVDRYRPDDAALEELARIVHGADFADEVGLVPESAGLRAISGGFPLVAGDDHEIVERAAFLYDALYASLKARLGVPG